MIERMNKHQALDFARHIIPWIQAETKLTRNGMALPTMHVVDDVEAFIADMAEECGARSACDSPSQDIIPRNSLSTAGAYERVMNVLVLRAKMAKQFSNDNNGELDRVYKESVIVHELTHYLQNANKTLRHGNIPQCELQAYMTQMRYVRSQGVDPGIFMLTPEYIMVICGMMDIKDLKQNKGR